MALSKNVTNYFIRTMAFLLLCRNFSLNIIESWLVSIFNFALGFFEEGIFVVAALAFWFSIYLLAEICGLFKKLDKLNFFIALLIILIVDFLFCYSKTLVFQFNPFKISNGGGGFFHFLPFCFVFHRFMNYLNKNSFLNNCYIKNDKLYNVCAPMAILMFKIVIIAAAGLFLCLAAFLFSEVF